MYFSDPGLADNPHYLAEEIEMTKLRLHFGKLTTLKAMVLGMATVAGLTVLAAEPVRAQAYTKDCPLEWANRTITDRLPSDWWTPPIGERLSGTRVGRIGGQNALICEYGAAGTIQRYEPEGEDCTANSRGFACQGRAVVRATPPVHSTGGVEVPGTYVIDLDSGRLDTARGDVWLQAVTASERYMTPSNGAQISNARNRGRGKDGCASAGYSNNRLPMSRVEVGSWICVRTSEGRISEFRVNEIRGGSPYSLVLGYTTWN